MIKKMPPLLALPVISDYYGQALKEGGGIGLARIQFNRTHWVAQNHLSCFLIPDGGRLIIRREGKMIFVERDTGLNRDTM